MNKKHISALRVMDTLRESDILCGQAGVDVLERKECIEDVFMW